MAALFWRSVLLVEMSASGAFAGWLTAVPFEPSPARLALAAVLFVAALLALQVLWVLFSYLMARLGAGAAARSPSTSTVLGESGALLRAMVLMSLTPRRRLGPAGEAHGLPRSPGTHAPVVLVHGILCNRGIWRRFERRLAAAGFTRVFALDLEPMCADIDTHAATLARTVTAIHCTTGERVTLVGHSMGGLVARAALRGLAPGIVRQIVTLGTPHHGSALARYLPCTPARQMRHDSPWLNQLNTEQATGPGVPIACLYSLDDNLVVPATSGACPASTPVRLAGLGHLSLPFSATAFAAVREQILGTEGA